MTHSSTPVSEVLQTRILHTEKEKDIYTPIFFRLNAPAEQQRFFNLLQQFPHIRVYDQIQSQLKELVKSRKPSTTLSAAEIEKDITETLGSKSYHEYGVWVYYPWCDRIVHILDEAEFIELRTDRNRYKITIREREILATKKIGVIGLSVGQSVSLTMAMERSFGELRIADFDELEITNLNRLRSGVYNMGIKKTVLVAREIAEIDPFLKVTCFHDGIRENNLDDFLLKDDKLDLLIDECDSVDIKINCRIAAKKYGIPVVMEASDRGTIDIERFDLENNRPILHGFIEHLDISKLKDLKTNEEKVPYILPIAGVETLSARMKASAMEVGQTISTWPQLASAVTLGGGITADVCRRILLNLLHQSGRYFIDIEELISDPALPRKKLFETQPEELTLEKMKSLADKISSAKEQNKIDESVVEKLVEAAVMAPSAGNNQPWKWYFNGSRLFLYHDKLRSRSYGDFENMASYMALGTALENLRLKAAAEKLETNISLFPLAPGEMNPVAIIEFIDNKKIPVDELIKYIGVRCTNRNIGKPALINPEIKKEIIGAVTNVHGSSLQLIDEQGKLKQLAGIISRAEKLRIFIPEGHYDLFEKELRWSIDAAEQSKDGLDLRTFDLSASEAVGLRLARDPKAIELISEWNGGGGLERITRKAVLSSSAIGFLTMPGFTPSNCVNAGMAVERAWLTATKNQLAVQPLLAPLFHWARIVYGKKETMPAAIRNQFLELYEEFKTIVDMEQNQTGLFLFRLGYANEPAIKSLRLDIKDTYFS
ncbi:MAG: hypothetical protein JWN76_1376 [Chitinophagaceae bacterium]|nr:hypothetical protein [Chitinophagaceae bacterium]